MVNLGLISVGDLSTDIEIFFEDTQTNDTNTPLDISGATAIQITIIDPDGNIHGPFDMELISSGTDGGAHYTTDSGTSIWDRKGPWTWYGTATLTTGEYSTNPALREVLG